MSNFKMYGGTKAPFYPSSFDACGCVYNVNVGEFMSRLTFSWGLSPVLKLVIMKYDIVSNRLQSLTKVKQGVTLFPAVSDAPAC